MTMAPVHEEGHSRRREFFYGDDGSSEVVYELTVRAFEARNNLPPRYIAIHNLWVGPCTHLPVHEACYTNYMCYMGHRQAS